MVPRCSKPSSRSSWSATSVLAGGRLAVAGALLHQCLDLRMHQVLHLVRVADVGETLLAVFAAGLDEQVAGAQHALEHALVEVDVVDALERDLDAALGEDALTEDDALRRDDEVGGEPLQEAADQPQRGDDQQRHGREPSGLAWRVARLGLGEHHDADDDAADQRCCRLREVPPVGVHVECNGLTAVEILLRVRHVRHCSARSEVRRVTASHPTSIVAAVPADPMLHGLDAEQREAVTTTAAPLAIVAAAGSGKTTVLTRRIAYRVAHGTAMSQHVLALTFTRDAAAELKRRLRKLDIREPIEAGTFHGVALRLLRDRALAANHAPPQVANDRTRLAREVLSELKLQVEPYAALADLDWARARMVPPDRYEGAVRITRRRTALPPARFADFVRRVRAAEAPPRRHRFRRSAGAHHRGAAHRQGLGRRRALALPPSVRRRGARPQPAAARDAGGAARWPARPVPGGRPAPGHLRLERRRPHHARRGRGALPGRHRRRAHVQLSLLAAGGSRGCRRARRQRAAGQQREPPARCGHGGGAAGAPTTPRRRRPSPATFAACCTTTAAATWPCWRAPTNSSPCCSRRSPSSASTPSAATAAHRSTSRCGPRTAAPAASSSPSGSTPRSSTATSSPAASPKKPTATSRSGEPGLFRGWVERRDPFDDLEPTDFRDAVALLTFHAAKGREWWGVVITGAEEGLVPHGSSSSPAQLAEEARLFYVAITRAAQHLLITHCAQRQRKAVAPSRWLQAVTDSTAEDVPAPPPTRTRLARRPAGSVPRVALRHRPRVRARPTRPCAATRCCGRWPTRRPPTAAELAQRSGITETAALRLRPLPARVTPSRAPVARR